MTQIYKIEILIKKLKDKVAETPDNMIMHEIYDQILKEQVKISNPNLLKLINKITKGRSFWYS